MPSELKRGPLPYLLAATVALYLVSVNAPFVYDDLNQILLNPRLHSLAHPLDCVFNGLRQIRVVENFSYAIDWAVAGGAPWPFHLTNIALHALCGWLLCRVLSRPLKTRPFVLYLGLALFLAHPLQIQSVTYISGRVSEIQFAFYLGCLELYVLNRQRVTAGLFALVGLALFAKESCLFIPLLLVAYDLTLGGRKLRELPSRGLLALVLMALVLLFATTLLNEPHPAAEGTVGFGLHPIVEYFITNGYYHAFGAGLLALPAWQSIHHEYPPFTPTVAAVGVLAWCVLGILVVWAWRARRRAPLGAFLVFFYLIASGPTGSIVQFINPFAEYRLYQQNVSLFFAVALGFEWLARRLRRPKPVQGLAVSLLVCLALASVAQQRLWSDKVRLYQDALESYPGSYLLAFDLANSLAERGEDRAALDEFAKAEQAAAKTGERYALGPRYNAALIHARRGDLESAARELQSAPPERFLFGYPAPEFYALELDVLGRLGRRAEAARLLSEAKAHFPDAVFKPL